MQKKKVAKVGTVFDCPVCNHTNCVECKIDRRLGVGSVECTQCPSDFNTSFQVNRLTELDEAVDLFYQWRDDMERRKELARRKRTAEGAGITTTTVSPAVPRPSSSAPSSSSASNRGGASNRHRNNSDSDSGSDSDSDGDGDSSHLVSAGRSVVSRDRVVPRDRAGLHHQQQMFLDVSEDEEEDEDEEEEEDEEDEEAEQQQRGAGIVEDSGEEDGGM